MLRKILFAIAVIVALVVIAVVVLPYFVGLRAERGFEYRVEAFNASHPAVVLHVDEYHRGFYSSAADVTLNGVTQDESRVFGIIFGTGAAAQFHIRVNHGPIPFAAFGTGHTNFMPVLYTAEFRGKNLPALSFLGALKPDVYLVQYFDGATATHIVVPPGRFGLGVIGATWQGGDADIHLDAARNRAQYKGTVKPVNFQFMNSGTGETYSGVLKGIEFSGTRRKAEHDFWVGAGTSSLGGIVVSSDGTELVSLAAARGETRVSETARGRWLGGSVHVVQKGGTIKGWRFSQFTLNGSIARLDAAALRRGLDAVRTQSVQAKKKITTARARAMMGNAFAPAITTATTAKLTVKLAAPSGTAALAAHVGFAAPAGGSRAAASPSLAALAVGEGNVGFDRKLVDDFARKVLAPTLPLVLDQSLKSLVAQGYLTLTPTGDYHALIGYRAGVFTINGRSVNGGEQANASQTAGKP